MIKPEALPALLAAAVAAHPKTQHTASLDAEALLVCATAVQAGAVIALLTEAVAAQPGEAALHTRQSPTRL